MQPLALNLRNIFAAIAKGIQYLILLCMHQNVLVVLALAAAVTAAFLHWGREGALWTFAIVAMLLSMANAQAPK